MIELGGEMTVQRKQPQTLDSRPLNDPLPVPVKKVSDYRALRSTVRRNATGNVQLTRAEFVTQDEKDLDELAKPKDDERRS